MSAAVRSDGNQLAVHHLSHLIPGARKQEIGACDGRRGIPLHKLNGDEQSDWNSELLNHGPCTRIEIVVGIIKSDYGKMIRNRVCTPQSVHGFA